MMRDSVLYFPHIEIQNKEWLKNALLLWDNVYRIVPTSYTPRDDDEMKYAVDAGLVRAVTLENQDVRGFTREFQTFVQELPFSPAGLEYDELAYLHPEKVDAHLYPFLEQYAVGESRKGWIELPKEIVRGYMFFLANQVAKRRGLGRCTDDKYSFAVSAYFSEDANFDEFLYDRNAVGFYSSLIINDVLPCNVAQIPIAKIVAAVDRSRDERTEFRRELLRFGEQLHRCESKDHAFTIFTDYKRDLMAAKERLKTAQGFLNKEDVGSIFSMGIPVALTAYGALASGSTEPFTLHTLSSSLLIGAMAAYHDYKRSLSAQENPYGASYLISLEHQFAGTGTYPAFDRYLEEFIND